jgi:hypothetical protein
MATRSWHKRSGDRYGFAPNRQITKTPRKALFRVRCRRSCSRSLLPLPTPVKFTFLEAFLGVLVVWSFPLVAALDAPWHLT